MARAPFQNIPTQVLEDADRAQQADAWAQEQRAAVADEWAQAHRDDFLAQAAKITAPPDLDAPSAMGRGGVPAGPFNDPFLEATTNQEAQQGASPSFSAPGALPQGNATPAPNPGQNGAADAGLPTSLGDAFTKAMDSANAPDFPGLPLAGAPRILPPRPGKDVQPPQDTQEKITTGQPLGASDVVDTLTKMSQAQGTGTPAIAAGAPDLADVLATEAGTGKLGAATNWAERRAVDLVGPQGPQRGGEMAPIPEGSGAVGSSGSVFSAGPAPSGGGNALASAGGTAKPPAFVPPEDFNIRVGKNDKATAGDIRTELTGVRNAQIVRGNQLADQIKRMAPDEQGALYWAHEAGGDPATLQKWAADPDPKLDPYRADIQGALNLSPGAQRALQLGEQYYTEMGQAGLDTGAIRNVLENYQQRIYKPEPPRDFVRTETSTGLGQSTSHALQRVYDTAYDAVKAGKQFATTDYADALGIHNEEMARVNANRQMAGAMQDSGLGAWVRPDKVPQGWQPVGSLEKNVPLKDASGQAIIGPDGDQVVSRSVFAAPEGIAKGLAAVADPNFLNKVDTLRKVARFQGVVKTVDLSLSAFHHFTMGMQTIYQTLAQPSSLVDITRTFPRLTQTLTGGPFGEFEQDFARHGGITAKVQGNLDILAEFRQLGEASAPGSQPGRLAQMVDQARTTAAGLPGAGLARGVAKASDSSTNFLFGQVQRYLKVMDYQNKVTGWVADHPNATDDALVAAKRGFAREVNAAYGGLNWEQMGVSKPALTGMRLALLAPDWTVSNLALGKYALSGGTEGASARRHIASALAAGTLLTEGANYILTGHSTAENPPGHQTEVMLGPHAYVSMYRGGIGDLLKLGSMVAESGPEGIARFIQGKGSPIARTIAGGLTNTDYNGRPIVPKGAGPIKGTADAAGFVARSLLPVPLGLSNAAGYLASGKATIPGTIGVLTGVGRYSQAKEPDEQAGRAGPPAPPKPPAPPRPPAPVGGRRR